MNITLQKPFYNPQYFPLVANEFGSKLNVNKTAENETSFSLTFSPYTMEPESHEIINMFLNRFLEVSIIEIFK